MPTRSAKHADWLPYWPENVIKPRRKRTTYAKYETHVRLYSVPMLGIKRLEFSVCEIVGLRWEKNVDLDRREIRVRTPRQRVGGETYEDDPKGRRRKQTLPLPAICVAPLRWQRLHQAAMREKAGTAWEETGYVFATRTVGRSSPGTCTGRSSASPGLPASGRSGCTMPGTAAPPCSPRLGWLPAW